METSKVTQANMMSRGMVSIGKIPEELLQGRGVGLLPLFQKVPEPAAFGQGIEGAEDRYRFVVQGLGEGAFGDGFPDVVEDSVFIGAGNGEEEIRIAAVEEAFDVFQVLGSEKDGPDFVAYSEA